MQISTFIVLLIIEIVCAIIMRKIAKKRGASETVWFIVGLILGPFAFLLIPFIKYRKT